MRQPYLSESTPLTWQISTVEVDASGALVRCAFGRGVQRVSLSRLGAGVVEAYTAARADALAGVRGAAVEAFGADNPILAPLMGGGDGE